MSAEALESPWRARFTALGGSEPLSPRTLLIQGLDDLSTPQVPEGRPQSSAPDDWREVLRELYPTKYEDMTISVSTPTMASRGSAAGFLSPVILNTDAVSAPKPHGVQYPLPKIKSNAIGSPPFILGPPPKSPARRTKLRSEEEQEVADILVMLRSRSTTRTDADASSDAITPASATLAALVPVVTPSEPTALGANDLTPASTTRSALPPIDLPSGRPQSSRRLTWMTPLQHSPVEPPSSTSPPPSPPPLRTIQPPVQPLDSNAPYPRDAHMVRAPRGPRKAVEVKTDDTSGGEEPADESAAEAASEAANMSGAGDNDWTPGGRVTMRRRLGQAARSQQARAQARRESMVSREQAQALFAARTVDQGNELEKMLRDIGFKAIRTERTTISCSLCQQKFPSRMFAVRHAQRDHLGVKPFECNICKMRFVRLDSVPRHIKNVHQHKKSMKRKARP